MGHRTATSSILVAVLASTALLACESAEARCGRLQGEAAQAWQGYVDALTKEAETARSARDTAKGKLEGEVHQRHQVDAQRQADQQVGSEKSSAWYRTFLAAEQAQCAKDPECLELKVRVTQSEAELADLKPRLDAARAALAAAKGDVEAARKAADAVPKDEQRAGAETARAASGEATATCAELKR